jgi:hypothetical protein
MSRTYKDEHKTDGWNTGRRLERQARPAGRMLAILELERHAHGEDDELVLELEARQCFEDEEVTRPSPWDSDCGCYCRRCLLHGDCGGCVAEGGHP